MVAAENIELEELPIWGTGNILVVCDAPTKKAWAKDVPIEGPQLRLFAETVSKYGFTRSDFTFISPCPPVPEEVMGSDARMRDFIAPYRDQLWREIEDINPDLVVCLGATACRQVSAKAIKITKARGQIHEYKGCKVPVLAMLSTGHVLRQPHYRDIFTTDARALEVLRDNNYDPHSFGLASDKDVNYRWCLDLQFLIDNPPKIMSVDSETTGLRWYSKKVVPLTVQLCWEEGNAVSVPVDCAYYPKLSMRRRALLIKQLKTLLEDPRIVKIGHNLKYDAHILRDKLDIHIRGGKVETMILAFAADDNMQDKSLDECVRRWVPPMTGYADEFNAKTDKSRMREVSHEEMLDYGCGDADANFRLAKALVPLVRKDPKQWNVYNRVQIPAITAFQDYVEPVGLEVDVKELANLQKQLDVRFRQLNDDLMDMVPRKVKRKHASIKNGLRFSRPDFIRDILFSKEGYNLTPKVFTKGTKNLKNDDEKIPSTSVKDHLSYFEDNPFVSIYREYSSISQMRKTYVGVKFDEKKKGPTGFWQYLIGGKVHPSYMLHGTSTGRTSSKDPNGQNFPKRGELAKAYRKIFKAPKGYRIVEADLSQAELRIAAWMANEKNMLEIYRKDGDIHKATAAAIIGISYDEFVERSKDTTPLKQCVHEFNGAQTWLNRQPKDERDVVSVAKFLKDKRQQAKPVNFGFLYGMGWRSFMAFAKTDYGVTFTEVEAQEVRKTFFRKYPRLVIWHETMRQIAHERGYVRSLHGALRRLPEINSNDEGIVALAERNAINSPVQRFASDLGLIALARICRDMPDTELLKPVAFIHDALIFLVREDKAEELAGNIKWYMETPPLESWFGLKAPLPMKADADVGDDLSDMEELEGLKPIKPEWANVLADAA